MGYLRFIRVATCCIVIQVTLLSFTSAFPQTDGGKKSPEKAVKVNDVIVKDVEDEPGRVEDLRKTYHATTTISQNEKTKHGRRKEESTSTDDTETHNAKRIEHSVKDGGRRMDEVKVDSELKNHEEKKNVDEIDGREIVRTTEETNGAHDLFTKTTEMNQELTNGSVNSIKQKSTEDIYMDKKTLEEDSDWEDQQHGEVYRTQRDAETTSRIDGTLSANTYLYIEPNDSMAIKSTDRTRSANSDTYDNYTDYFLRVDPHDRQLLKDRITEKRNVQTDMKETETDVSHETAIHDLHVNDRVTQDHNRSYLERESVNSEKKIKPETGSVVRDSTLKRNVEKELVRQIDRLNVELKPKVPYVKDLNVSLETVVIEKDNRNIKTEQQAKTVRTAPDGNRKTETVVESGTEDYDMSNSEPKITKTKHSNIVSDSAKNQTGATPAEKTAQQPAKTTKDVKK